MKAPFVTLCLISIGICSSAQTGPAGVGTSANNTLWLKADAGTSTTTNNNPVSAWNDQSGNVNHATQATGALQPIYVSSLMNGMPAIKFDNATGAANSDELVIGDNNNLDNTAGLTIFTVTQPNNLDGSSARAIISKRQGTNNNESYMLFYYTSDKINVDVDGTGDRFPTNTTFVNNTNYIATLVYDGTLPAATRAQMYVGDQLETLPVHSESSTTIPNYLSNVTIGTLNTGDGRPFGGHIAEIVLYTKALNAAERIIVSNYLSSKYAIALSANDKYAGDTPGNGNYDFEVAGVGTEASGSNASVSSAITGGLSVTQVSGFQAGDYLVFGHQSGANSVNTSDIGGMTGANKARWNRIWYFDVTSAGAAEQEDIVFDCSDGGLPAVPIIPSNYVLLRRNGTSGNWTEVTNATSISGDRITFAGVSITLDGYYTLGTHDATNSPLPIYLKSFTGTMTPAGVELFWTTLTEKDNQSFSVERSAEGKEFESIAEIPGAGTSFVERKYTALDPMPLEGKGYYRLKQIDADKSFTYSNIIVVASQEAIPDIKVFPNPAFDNINIHLTGQWAAPFMKIFNANGQLVYSAKAPEGNSALNVSVGDMPKGLYLLVVTNGLLSRSERFLVR